MILLKLLSTKATTGGVLYKKVFLKISQNPQASRPATLLKKIPTQVFSYELCKNFKNTFLYRIPPDHCFCIQDHHLFEIWQICCVKGLNSREIYDILIAENVAIPSSQQCYNNLFREADLVWKDIDIFPRVVSLETKVKPFQYMLLNIKCFSSSKRLARRCVPFVKQ